MTYPRIYKPKGSQFFLCWAICFLFFGVFAQALIQHPESYKSWGMIFGFIVATIFLYQLIVVSMGYKVTLFPDAVEVTTIFGTKKMHRSDIRSYSYYCGKYEKGIELISRNFTQSTAGIALLYDKSEKNLRIPLTFDRDPEFDEWITSLPCEVGGTPLPSVRKC